MFHRVKRPRSYALPREALPALAALLDDREVGAWACEPTRRADLLVLDTADGRLQRAGTRLLAELGPRGSVSLTWSTDAPGEPVVVVQLASLPSWSDDVPPGPLRDRLGARTDGRVLLPRTRVRTSVTDWTCTDTAGAAVGRLHAHDVVTVQPVAAPGTFGTVDAAAAAGAAELLAQNVVIELRPQAGHGHLTDAIDAAVRAIGGVRLDADLPTLATVASGVEPRGLDAGPAAELRIDDAALDACRAVCSRLATSIEANWSGAVGRLDDEFLHELRVALRRTRSVLQMAGGVVAEPDRERFLAGFRQIAASTSAPRDLDVLAATWDELAGPDAERLRPVLDHERCRAHEQFVQAMSSGATAELLGDWHRWLDPATSTDPDRRGADAGEPIGPLAARRVTSSYRRLLAAGRAIDASSPPETVHELRKMAKTVRYRIELFGSLFDRGSTARFVARLKDVQDVLGTFQDDHAQALVLAQLRDTATGPGADDLRVALDRVTARLAERADEAREQVTVRFARIDSRAAHRELDRAVGGLT
jgi:CHAD domain-containing protein